MKYKTQIMVAKIGMVLILYILTLYAMWIGQILEFVIAVVLTSISEMREIILPNTVEKFLEVKDEKEGK